MAFGLLTSLQFLIPSPKAAIFNFTQAESINHIRITNTTNSAKTISLWFDFDGTSSGDTEKVLSDIDLSRDESVVMDGIYDFQSGGRITGEASVVSSVSIHWTRASI